MLYDGELSIRFGPNLHALPLGWPWKNRVKGRVKGRDGFDFEGYAGKAIVLNRKHLAIRAAQSGHLDPEHAQLDKVSLGEFLEAKITLFAQKASAFRPGSSQES